VKFSAEWHAELADDERVEPGDVLEFEDIGKLTVWNLHRDQDDRPTLVLLALEPEAWQRERLRARRHTRPGAPGARPTKSQRADASPGPRRAAPRVRPRGRNRPGGRSRSGTRGRSSTGT
jgi:hypothetical protein